MGVKQIPSALLRISFPTGRNPHHSAALLSLRAPGQRQRKTVVCLAVVLVLCTSGLAQLWRRTEKKKLFITVRVAQISYPGLVLGQFYKAEVWKKKSIFQQTNFSFASCAGSCLSFLVSEKAPNIIWLPEGKF